MEDIRVITARRVYSFDTDDVRLTVLSTTQCLNMLREAFKFQSPGYAALQFGTGAPPPTNPPGILMQNGELQTDQGPLPVRAIFIDARRVTIDVAAPSEAIDLAYDALMEIVGQLTALDGSPVIGEPATVSEHSEISARLDFLPAALVSEPMHHVMAEHLGLDGPPDVLVPSIRLTHVAGGEEFPGDIPDASIAELSIRFGTDPRCGVFYSKAPLDTSAHAEMLGALEKALSRSSNRG